jgi:hypothetical protein
VGAECGEVRGVRGGRGNKNKQPSRVLPHPLDREGKKGKCTDQIQIRFLLSLLPTSKSTSKRTGKITEEGRRRRRRRRDISPT